MDPKNLPNLDPKLKEVYERVMKTSTQPPPQSPQPPPPASPLGGPPTTAPSQPNQPQPPVPPAVNNEPSPVLAVKPPAAELSPTPQNTFHSTQVFNPDAPITDSSSKDVTPKDVASKGKRKISPVVLALAGVIFFVIYAVFWVSFFKVSLPF